MNYEVDQQIEQIEKNTKLIGSAEKAPGDIFDRNLEQYICLQKARQQ